MDSGTSNMNVSQKAEDRILSDNSVAKKCHIDLYMNNCALSAHLLLFWDLDKSHDERVTARGFVRPRFGGQFATTEIHMSIE